jgi:hypothetical protein
MSKVQCIDDSARPESIPLSYWVKKDSYYNIINSFRDMNGVELVQLLEIDLTKLGNSYKGFASSRFAPIETKKDEVKQQQPAYV